MLNKRKLVDETRVFHVDFVFKSVTRIEDHIYNYTSLDAPIEIKIVYKSKEDWRDNLRFVYEKVSKLAR